MNLVELEPMIFDKFDEIKYQIGDFIMRLPICEQSSASNVCKSKMQSIAGEVVEHLIKLYKWHDPQEYKGYTTDIANWMYKIDRLRSANKKRPNYTQYMDWILLEEFADVNSITKTIKGMSKYHHLHPARTDAEVYDIIKVKMGLFASLMSQNKFNDAYDVLDRVD